VYVKILRRVDDRLFAAVYLCLCDAAASISGDLHLFASVLVPIDRGDDHVTAI
jgi:hypothetical protein